jgi:hypothetical protein
LPRQDERLGGSPEQSLLRGLFAASNFTCMVNGLILRPRLCCGRLDGCARVDGVADDLIGASVGSPSLSDGSLMAYGSPIHLGWFVRFSERFLLRGIALRSLASGFVLPSSSSGRGGTSCCVGISRRLVCDSLQRRLCLLAPTSMVQRTNCLQPRPTADGFVAPASYGGRLCMHRRQLTICLFASASMVRRTACGALNSSRGLSLRPRRRRGRLGLFGPKPQRFRYWRCTLLIMPLRLTQ